MDSVFLMCIHNERRLSVLADGKKSGRILLTCSDMEKKWEEDNQERRKGAKRQERLKGAAERCRNDWQWGGLYGKTCVFGFFLNHHLCKGKDVSRESRGQWQWWKQKVLNGNSRLRKNTVLKLYCVKAARIFTAIQQLAVYWHNTI